MFRVIQTFALVGAFVTAAACGSTTSSNPPVTTPQSSTRGVSQAPPAGPTEVNSSERGVIPAGQEVDVRLQTELSSETAQAEQRFEATTAVDVNQNGRVLIPAGSVVRGVVTAVDRPGRVDRVGRLTLSFDQVTIRGRSYPFRGMATQAFESGGVRDEVGTVGAGAGVGGVVGGLLGGVKGAVLGAVIGAGGAIAATEGKDVHLPAGSYIRVRFDTPVTVR